MDNDMPVVIITGSSGLIGSAVRHALVNTHRVVGFDHHNVPHPTEAGEYIPCDMTSDQAVANAVQRIRHTYGTNIASVIHLAAYYDFSGEPSPLYEKLTVRGTERLIKQLRAFSVGQFVFSSTMLVNAPCKPGEHINEDWPLEPKWDYPRSKVDTERLILAQHGSIPVVLLRIAGVYTDRCQSIPLANQIQRIYERQLTAKVFPGDISTGQSFVHLDDLTDVFAAVVQRRASLPPASTLLIGEPEPLSYDELQRTFAWLIHHEAEWKTTQLPKPVAKAGAWAQDKIPGMEEPFIKPWMIDLADDHYALDISRAHKLLDWTPRRSLRDTLPKMIDFLKADAAAFYRVNKLKGPPRGLPHQVKQQEPAHA